MTPETSKRRERALEWLKQQTKPASVETIVKGLGEKLEPWEVRHLYAALEEALIDPEYALYRTAKGFQATPLFPELSGWVTQDRDQNFQVLPTDGRPPMRLAWDQEQLSLLPKDKIQVSIRDTEAQPPLALALALSIKDAVQLQLVGIYEHEYWGSSVQILGRAYQNCEITAVEDENTPHADHHDRVVLTINRDKSDYLSGKLYGVITHVLPRDVQSQEIHSAIHQHNIPNSWSKDLEALIPKLSEVVAEDDKKGRRDLRELPLVTIDGEDARDFDDAVYCEPHEKGGWRLIVAIADVSHYVKPNSPLDQNAYERGTSVYFPGSVVPMLPEVLSNGLCSLKPQVDRLCLACEMHIDASGELKDSQFFDAVMHSHARLTYHEAQAIFEQDAKASKRFATLLYPLQTLYDLYIALHRRRMQRGALDFDTTEAIIMLAKNGEVEALVPSKRLDAHRVIEECMLAANVSAANYLKVHKLGGLYRIHASPPEDKWKALKDFLHALGLKLPKKEVPSPKELQTFLETLSDRPDVDIIQMMVLRSLSQAMYSPENIGHYGLAYDAYLHFTSPIRRYPDLLTHRAIRAINQNDKKAIQYFQDQANLQRLATHCVRTERQADDASRDVAKALKCSYLEQHLGETFWGRIIGTARFGLFVELDDVMVEGLVHISELKGDFYQFDETQQLLRGERTGRTYKLGEKVLIQVLRSDQAMRQIDFALIQKMGESPQKDKPRKRKGKKKRGK